MYEIGQKVVVLDGGPGKGKPAQVADRYRGGSGRVSYLVEWPPHGELLTGSDNLRAADEFCDGCSEWRPRSSFNCGEDVINPHDGVIEARFCFVCTRTLGPSW